MAKVAKPLGSCSFEGCSRGRHCKGLCAAHYAQQLRRYELRPLLETISRSCSIEGCDRDVYAVRARLCHMHYARQRRGWHGPGLSRNPELEDRPCDYCGNLFLPARARTTRCCSDRCNQKNARLFKTYGIRGVDVRRLLDSQAGGCAVCGTVLTFDAPDTHIDHCHATGRVRGLLCRGCNVGLGCFEDDPIKLQAAIRYLS